MAKSAREKTATQRTSNETTESFSAFGLNPQLLTNLAAMEIVTPTPIQSKAIPVVLDGKDVVGLAQTGTGKTAAFMLPIINKLLEGKMGTLRALVVVPTRELAEQVLQTARALSEGTGLRATSVYGGVRIDHHKDRLRKPLDLIVGCPGRLLDLMQQRALSLASIEHLVLDEADQMFDMGFIIPIRKLIKATPSERQTLLFSATMPEEIETLTKEALSNPIKIQVAPISSPDSVTHVAYKVPAHLKQKLLSHLLGTMTRESVLVFTRTKHKARKLSRALEREGVKATCLQGNLSQSQRMTAMKGFRSGTYSVMVATDIASRGIDISSVSHVVNFDFPDTHEAYLHRTGRTGRATRTGDALTFIAPEDEGDFRRLERALRIPFAKAEAEGFDYTQKPAPREESEQDDFGREERGFQKRRSSSRQFGGRGDRFRGRGDRRDNRGSGRSSFEGSENKASTTSDRFGGSEGGRGQQERRAWSGRSQSRSNGGYKPRFDRKERKPQEASSESFGNTESSNRSRFDYEQDRKQGGRRPERRHNQRDGYAGSKDGARRPQRSYGDSTRQGSAEGRGQDRTQERGQRTTGRSWSKNSGDSSNRGGGRPSRGGGRGSFRSGNSQGRSGGGRGRSSSFNRSDRTR